jgi:FkbM family methyltransferase
MSLGALISYAQNLEDVLLARVFDGMSRGFYVDVGAYDPEFLSITKHFYDRGWHGINVEPVPAAHRKFERLRPRDINLAVAAGREEGEATLFIPASSEFATLDQDVAEHSAAMLGDKSITASTVRVRPLTQILDQHEVTHIDFLVIDVEGAERSVLEGLDLACYRPVVIVCEATAPAERLDFDQPETVFTHHHWEPLLTGTGYQCVFFDGLNRFYLRQESKDLSRRFAIPVGPIRDSFRRAQDEIVVADWRAEAAAAREQVTQERNRAQAELSTADRRIDELMRELERHREELRNGEGVLAATRDAVGGLTRRAETQHHRIRELERIVEALRYGLWSRDHKLDELAMRRRKLSRVARVGRRGH